MNLTNKAMENAAKNIYDEIDWQIFKKLKDLGISERFLYRLSKNPERLIRFLNRKHISIKHLIWPKGMEKKDGYYIEQNGRFVMFISDPQMDLDMKSGKGEIRIFVGNPNLEDLP